MKGIARGLLVCVLVLSVSSCAPQIMRTQYMGSKTRPHVEITRHNIGLLGYCVGDACDVRIYVELTLHNPWRRPINMVPFCETIIEGMPTTVEKGSAITVARKQTVKKVVLAYTVAMPFRRTDVTVQCGAEWR